MPGDDGIESLDPWDSHCRALSRSIRNPIERANTTSRNPAAKQFGSGPRKLPKGKGANEEYAKFAVVQKERGAAKRAREAALSVVTPGAVYGAGAVAANAALPPATFPGTAAALGMGPGP